MKMTNDDYSQLVRIKTPTSPILKNCLFAFLVGGAICCAGQALFNIYSGLGLQEQSARSCVSVTLIFLTCIFTGFGVFDNLAKIAGAGTIVPITGFANSIASPAVEFKSEGWVLGLGAKMFVIAGPVIVYGTVTSVIYGVIFWAVTAAR